MSVSASQRTYAAEKLRAVAHGFLETGGTTFLLLIAVRAYDASPNVKAFLAAAGSLGLLLTPLTVSWVARLRWRTAHAAALLTGVGATGFFLAAAVPALPVFVAGAVVATASSAALVPLLTQMYQENYPEHARGKWFSRTVMIRVASFAVCSELAGRALAADIGRFPWLLLGYALAFVFSAGCLLGCATGPLSEDGGRHPFRALRYVRDDRLFRITLVSWMFMGFANLMMMPLRVEYLANPRYGLSLPTDQIALLTGVIPGAVRLFLAPVWGHLFDRINFFILRVILNLGFVAGIVAFFLGDTMPWLVFGAVLIGIANAGGDVAWSLWVTKIAPAHLVADYMSVHTFLTGVRGLLAPLLGFHLAAHIALPTLGYGAAALILLASALLVPEFRHGRNGRLGAAAS